MIELSDIQGLLVSDYMDLKGGGFLMLEITDSKKARQWLRSYLPQITNGKQIDGPLRQQIAFNYSGMEKLGATEFVEYGFSAEFEQGMTAEFRRPYLGDVRENTPENWQWGGPNNEAIDLMLMVYAATDSLTKDTLDQLAQSISDQGFRLVHRLSSRTNPGDREHFGFKDGISQPLLPGLGQKGMKENTIPDGEIILGYKNAYREYPETPLVSKDKDAEGILPKAHSSRKMRDFGKHGSYMVFRQMQQDVAGFWSMVQASAAQEKAGADIEDAIYLASKMFGRWPNGTPTTLSPDQENPADPGDTNDFLFHKNDPLGKGCPIGSHIRRCNPRDHMPDNYPKSSLRIANRHRILRRGRIYGPPLHPSYDPHHLATTPDDGVARGLQFICFNANIARQFEFVQQTWCHSTKFFGLNNEPDPIIGMKDFRENDQPTEFTVPATPVRRKFRNLRPMITIVGGSYFFMPGLSALRFLLHFQPEKEYSCPNSSERSTVS